MNTKALIFAAIAATFTSGAALAQSYDRDNRHDRNDRYEQSDRHHQGDRNDNRYRGERYDGNQRAQYGHDGRYDRGDRYERHGRYDRHNRYDGYRGDRRHYTTGSNYRVYRGGYLAHEYRGSRYVVSDWRQRRLYAPPRGYHWVQAGNDYALVALATGLIAQVLLNN